MNTMKRSYIRKDLSENAKWYLIQSRANAESFIELVTWRGDKRAKPFIVFDSAVVLLDRNQAVKLLREARK